MSRGSDQSSVSQEFEPYQRLTNSNVIYISISKICFFHNQTDKQEQNNLN